MALKQIKPLTDPKKKKSYNVKPTPQQKKAFEQIVKNGRNLGEGLLEAGYAESVAISPKKVTERIGWQQLLDEYIPEDLLAKKHKELLEKTDKEGGIDTQAVKAGLDMGYKLRGSYAAEKVEVGIEDMIAKQLFDRKANKNG